MTPLEVELPSRRATRRLGQALADALVPSALVILSGPLGAGKTFFVRGVLRAMGVPQREPVTSPTFSLVHEFDTEPRVLHADLYRLKDATELDPLGLAEARSAGAALLIEWGEPYRALLGGDALSIELALATQTRPRLARLTASGPLSADLLGNIARGLGEAPSETC
jgi:tRNA threonylcarbamoyladenosine biosynthesis protein TsaE